ncbi:MAG: hypothetical protein M0T80_12850 [Actinomycetota bacterium]|nr:hypothetical protein [Actinomycetota bacterium]
MAELRVEGDELRLVLSAAEKVEGLHGSLSVPLATVRGVEVLGDAHRAAGIRAGIKVGTRVPGVVEVGRVYGASAKRFVAVHHDTPRGVRIRFAGGDFDEWIVGCADPEAVAASIGAP